MRKSDRAWLMLALAIVALVLSVLVAVTAELKSYRAWQVYPPEVER